MTNQDQNQSRNKTLMFFLLQSHALISLHFSIIFLHFPFIVVLFSLSFQTFTSLICRKNLNSNMRKSKIRKEMIEKRIFCFRKNEISCKNHFMWSLNIVDIIFMPLQKVGPAFHPLIFNHPIVYLYPSWMNEK